MSKILIVEDDPAIRRVIALAVKSAGHSPVLEADTGDGGFAVIRRALHDGLLQIRVELFAEAVNGCHAELLVGGNHLLARHLHAGLERVGIRIFSGGQCTFEVVQHGEHRGRNLALTLRESIRANAFIAAAEVVEIRLHALGERQILIRLGSGLLECVHVRDIRLRGGFLRRFGSRLLLICHVGGHIFLRLLRGFLLLIHRSLSAFLPFHCYLSSFSFFCGG